MLMLSNQLYDRRVLDMRSGRETAKATSPIFNPNNLKVIGWWCQDKSKNTRVLQVSSLRDFNISGLIIDDENEMVDPEDIVRDREILDIDYQLIGKTVKTKTKKIGKVESFAFDPLTMLVHKLNVQPPIIKYINDSTIVIDRSQIIEITDKSIIIRDTEVYVSEKAKSKPATKLSPGTAPAV